MISNGVLLSGVSHDSRTPGQTKYCIVNGRCQWPRDILQYLPAGFYFHILNFKTYVAIFPIIYPPLPPTHPHITVSLCSNIYIIKYILLHLTFIKIFIAINFSLIQKKKSFWSDGCNLMQGPSCLINNEY